MLICVYSQNFPLKFLPSSNYVSITNTAPRKLNDCLYDNLYICVNINKNNLQDKRWTVSSIDAHEKRGDVLYLLVRWKPTFYDLDNRFDKDEYQFYSSEIKKIKLDVSTSRQNLVKVKWKKSWVPINDFHIPLDMVRNYMITNNID